MEKTHMCLTMLFVNRKSKFMAPDHFGSRNGASFGTPTHSHTLPQWECVGVCGRVWECQKVLRFGFQIHSCSMKLGILFINNIE